MHIRLMELRKAAGYKNRDEFAAKLGVNKYTYRSWESGAAMMNAEQVWACAVALGTDPNEVLGWYEEHPRAAAPPDDAHRQIVAAFDDLSEEGREVAVNVVSGMARTYPQADGAPRLVAQEASA